MKQSPSRCGLEVAFDMIGGKWKSGILWRLHPEPRRFGELKRLVVGISEKMLIQQLRVMEADGLIRREAFPEIPPRVQYSLTPLGLSLINLLVPLCEWGTRHLEERESREAPLVEDPCANPSACGEPFLGVTSS